MGTELEDVKYDGKNKLVVVTSKIEPGPDHIRQAFSQALELCEKEDCKKILIDGSNIKKLPPISTIWPISIDLIKHIKLIMKLRVAYVIPNEISSPFEYFEDYLANYGTPIQKFDDLESAKNWVLEDK